MNKISVWGLDTILATNLEGTFFFDEILSKLRLETDDEKNIKDNVVDNIKSIIKVALRLAIKKDLIITVKLKQALRALLDYGTEASSENIKEFLASQESENPLIFSGMSASEGEELFGNLFASSSDIAKQDHTAAINAIESIINSTEQDFSEE